MRLSFSLAATIELLACSCVIAGCGDDEVTRPPSVPVIPNAPSAQSDAGRLHDATGGTGGSPSSSPDASVSQCEGPSAARQPLKLTPVVTGLVEPLYVAAPPGDDSRLFVVQRPGVIRVVQDGQLLDAPFLDLTDRVITTAAEDGLVGFAFHPDYAQNGRFFVHYSTVEVGAPAIPAVSAASDAGGDGGPGTDAGGVHVTDAGFILADAGLLEADAGVHISRGASIISEFRVSSDPNRATRESERRVLVVNQLSTNHNGGMLTFNPFDGLLYLGFGDGDGIGDVNRQALNLTALPGKVLRIDVDGSTDGRPYGIPPGNVTGANVRPEIWSYGLRNPWRFSFDPCNGDLYLADVGQYAMEEINYEPGNRTGHNYGWNILEGTRCYNEAVGCDGTGTQPPVLTYPHEQGCAVIGGYVYRGQNIPSLTGNYIYADYCTGNFSTFRMQAGAVTEQQDITEDLNPTGLTKFCSFGLDNAGEIYAVSVEGGVYRIDPE
jgi:glucose/arabinose dehydrogenase